MSELVDRLRQLGLRATAAQLSDFVARVTKERSGAAQILESVAELEEQDRARRSLERRLSRSRLGRFKPMTDFDWAWPKKIDRDRLEGVLRLDFLAIRRLIGAAAATTRGRAPHGGHRLRDVRRHRFLIDRTALSLLPLAAALVVATRREPRGRAGSAGRRRSDRTRRLRR